jgi:hypothetical protein
LGVCSPEEGLWLRVGLFEEAVDGGLEFGEGAKYAALKASGESLAKKPSTALSQDAEVGVKWKVQRGRRRTTPSI